MKKKINLQFFIIAIIAVITTTIGITLVYYGLFQNQVKKDLQISAAILKNTNYFANPDDDSMQIDIECEDTRITWIDSDGTVLYDNDTNVSQLENHLMRPEVQQAFSTGVGETVRKSETMNKNTFYYAVLLPNKTVLRVATKANSILGVFVKAVPLVLLILLLIISICVLLSHVLTKQIIKPIEVMAKNIENTSQEPTYKELVPFINTIRKQHMDILSSAKIRQDFTANVSHELKTPLTAISGYAELMENHMVGPEKQEHFIVEIRKNANRLLSLINDIIRLSELDHGVKENFFEQLDLCQVVEESLDGLKVNAEKRKISLSFKGEHCMVRANREMMHELTENLVQNAIRYNNEGGSVEIRVFYKNAGACLEVKDNGIGIPQEDQGRVFERFYRVDKSRSKETGGTGLGLAIVKHIVELHGAKIELESKVNVGTTMLVSF